MATATHSTPGMLKALADERRLAMVRMLGDGQERCVCVLAEGLGMSQALVSHHVKQLREAGLVQARRQGRWTYVRLDRSALDALAGELTSLAEAVGLAASGCCGIGEGTDD